MGSRVSPASPVTDSSASRPRTAAGSSRLGLTASGAGWGVGRPRLPTPKNPTGPGFASLRLAPRIRRQRLQGPDGQKLECEGGLSLGVGSGGGRSCLALFPPGDGLGGGDGGRGGGTGTAPSPAVRPSRVRGAGGQRRRPRGPHFPRLRGPRDPRYLQPLGSRASSFPQCPESRSTPILHPPYFPRPPIPCPPASRGSSRSPRIRRPPVPESPLPRLPAAPSSRAPHFLQSPKSRGPGSRVPPLPRFPRPLASCSPQTPAAPGSRNPRPCSPPLPAPLGFLQPPPGSRAPRFPRSPVSCGPPPDPQHRSGKGACLVSPVGAAWPDAQPSEFSTSASTKAPPDKELNVFQPVRKERKGAQA
ncbi:basic proline-rich protein-like [Zalophus californianus]|uniref:Basic proline-rich protein-like n=1 Tax=Zalophus californianus TaxID=9704 RepID=A0A6P9EXN8_ZALCA|nr:basic proline-rich protein-like [Zalophus californianus]